MTLKEMLNFWLELRKKSGVKYRTYAKYESLSRNHISPSLGRMPVNKLTPLLLQQYVWDLVAKTSNNTARSVVGVLKNCFAAAVKYNVIEHNVASALELPAKTQSQNATEKTTEKCFTTQERNEIEQCLLQSGDIRHLGILLCFYTGLRIGELLALQWTDINFETHRLSVTKTCRDDWSTGKRVKLLEPPKTKSSIRTVPIPDILMYPLYQLSQVSKSEFIVCGKNGKDISVRAYQKCFSELLKKLGIQHHKFHAIRHTYATYALQQGMEVKSVAAVLGHKNPMVTLNVYAHAQEDYQNTCANHLGERLKDSIAAVLKEKQQKAETEEKPAKKQKSSQNMVICELLHTDFIAIILKSQ